MWGFSVIGSKLWHFLAWENKSTCPSAPWSLTSGIFVKTFKNHEHLQVDKSDLIISELVVWCYSDFYLIFWPCWNYVRLNFVIMFMNFLWPHARSPPPPVLKDLNPPSKEIHNIYTCIKRNIHTCIKRKIHVSLNPRSTSIGFFIGQTYVV